MTKSASVLRTRSVSSVGRASAAVVAALACGGCLISFDGYHGGSDTSDSSGAGGAGRSELTSGGVPASTGAERGGAGTETRAGDANLAGSTEGGAPNSGTGAAGASGAGNGALNGGGAGRTASGGTGATASAMGGAANAGRGGAGAANGGTANGGAGAANGGSSASAGTGGAVTHCPPGTTNRASQEVPLPAGGFYCIDHAEVRSRDYKAFLDAKMGSTSGQSAACSFNTSFQPDTTGQCNQYDPANTPNLPIACVDWCDAAAFCKWDGKHLCGKLTGGSNATVDFADASKSAWYRACSHAGNYDFPYGNAYKGNACIGLDNSAVHPLATPNTDCVGGYDALYDMSGNVAEWEDSCATELGATDQCLDRGGSYLDTNVSVGSSPSLQCNSNVHGVAKLASKPRSTRDKEIGFRCCSEAVAGPP